MRWPGFCRIKAGTPVKNMRADELLASVKRRAHPAAAGPGVGMLMPVSYWERGEHSAPPAPGFGGPGHRRCAMGHFGTGIWRIFNDHKGNGKPRVSAKTKDWPEGG